jgi:uncharacterized membrane protein YcaP (DUF421 family)
MLRAIFDHPSATGAAVIAAKTATIYLFLIIGLRWLGKREASQLNVYDLAMLMALANAAQNAMTAGLGNIGVGLVTSSVVVLLAWGLTRLILRNPRRRAAGHRLPDDPRPQGPGAHRPPPAPAPQPRRAAGGDPRHGLPDLEQVQTAVLEVDGSISVIPYPDKRSDRRPDGRPQHPDETEED